MPSPAFTPGEGGGKPAKPESENVWEFPWLVPQPPPEPEPEVTSVTPMINLVPPNPLPTAPVQQPQPESTSESTQSSQSFRLGEQILRRNRERARQDAAPQSGERSNVDNSRAELIPDIDEIKFQYFAGAQEITSDPVYMDYYLAARHNALLHEVQLICQHEGIPPALRGHPDWVLSLCAEYGIDEENHAEARAYVEHWMNGCSRHHITDDPLNDAWEEALTAYEMFKADENNEDAKAAYESEFDAYKALVENIYGVEFTHDASDVGKDTSWDLLGIRMAHVAFEEMAKALGIAVDAYFDLDWDDATAFRRIFGKIEIHNSIDPIPRNDDGTIKGLAQVEGDFIRIYWNEKERRNAYIIPNAMLHELGHILNANGAFAMNQFTAWFNLLEDHPGSRIGMGAPADDVLIGTNVIYSYTSAVQLPTLAQDIGVWNPDHVIFDEVREEFPTQIQALQQSKDESKNEITADAILNWVKHLITAGRFGFTSDEEGLNWQRIMGTHMDEKIRNAITYNIITSGEPISLTEEDKDRMPFPIPVGRRETKGSGSDNEGPLVRTGPGVHYDPVREYALDPETEVIILGRDKRSQDTDYDWVAVLYEGEIRWIFKGGLQISDDDWEDLPVLPANSKLAYDFSTSTQEDDSWFPILLRAAYGR